MAMATMAKTPGTGHLQPPAERERLREPQALLAWMAALRQLEWAVVSLRTAGAARRPDTLQAAELECGRALAAARAARRSWEEARGGAR